MLDVANTAQVVISATQRLRHVEPQRHTSTVVESRESAEFLNVASHLNHVEIESRASLETSAPEEILDVASHLHHVEIKAQSQSTSLEKRAPEEILDVASHLSHVEVPEERPSAAARWHMSVELLDAAAHLHHVDLDPKLLELSNALEHADFSAAAMAGSEAAGGEESAMLLAALDQAARRSAVKLEEAHKDLTEAKRESARLSVAFADRAWEEDVHEDATADPSAAGRSEQETNAAMRIESMVRGRSARKLTVELRRQASEDQEAKAEKARADRKRARQDAAEKAQAEARAKLEKAQAIVREAQSKLVKIQQQQVALSEHRLAVSSDEMGKVKVCTPAGLAHTSPAHPALPMLRCCSPLLRLSPTSRPTVPPAPPLPHCRCPDDKK